MRQDATIYVAGAEELIGSALVRRLRAHGYHTLCGVGGPNGKGTGDDAGPDLLDPARVAAFFEVRRPAFVFAAAGRSGGIAANQKYPADLMHDNLAVNTNLLHAAHRYGVTKLLYLASSCSYPKLCPQPMAVEQLMAGPLEPTNEAYAVAKLAGLKLCQAYRRQYGSDFIAAIPANAFGPGDDFSPEDSHVIGALIHRTHEAKLRGEASVAVWGTGRARREFIYADDLADACIFVMGHYSGEAPINLGGLSAEPVTGDSGAGNDSELSIGELAHMIRRIVGYRGELHFDATRPDGMPLKALDSTALARLGWRPTTGMEQALAATYQAYLDARRAAEGRRKGTE